MLEIALAAAPDSMLGREVKREAPAAAQQTEARTSGSACGSPLNFGVGGVKRLACVGLFCLFALPPSRRALLRPVA